MTLRLVSALRSACLLRASSALSWASIWSRFWRRRVEPVGSSCGVASVGVFESVIVFGYRLTAGALAAIVGCMNSELRATIPRR